MGLGTHWISKPDGMCLPVVRVQSAYIKIYIFLKNGQKSILSSHMWEYFITRATWKWSWGIWEDDDCPVPLCPLLIIELQLDLIMRGGLKLVLSRWVLIHHQFWIKILCFIPTYFSLPPVCFYRLMFYYFQ